MAIAPVRCLLTPTRAALQRGVCNARADNLREAVGDYTAALRYDPWLDAGWSETPTRNNSCCCHPLTGAPCLRLGPRTASVPPELL